LKFDIRAIFNLRFEAVQDFPPLVGLIILNS